MLATDNFVTTLNELNNSSCSDNVNRFDFWAHLRSVSFDMVFNFGQGLDSSQGRDEGQRLGRRAPVGRRLPVEDDDVQQDDDLSDSVS